MKAFSMIPKSGKMDLWTPLEKPVQTKHGSKTKSKNSTGIALISPEEAAQIMKNEEEERQKRINNLQEDIKFRSNPDRYVVENRGEQWTAVEPDKNTHAVQQVIPLGSPLHQGYALSTLSNENHSTSEKIEPATIIANKSTDKLIDKSIGESEQESTDKFDSNLKKLINNINSATKGNAFSNFESQQDKQLRTKVLKKLAGIDNHIVGGIYYKPTYE